MDPGSLRDALTALLGLATGVMSGAFGVGGAVVSTPGIRLLGVPALVAIGTTLPSIVPSALSGSLRYRNERLIDWRAVACTVPVGLGASVAGALLSEEVPGEGHLLMVATAALLGVTAWRMARGRDPLPARARLAQDATAGGSGGAVSCRAATVVGLVAGALSGLLGIGGGVVLVPAFVAAGLALKVAIATSLVCVGAFAVPGTLAHALLGNVDWRVALLLAATVVPGARLGAALTVRADDRRLRLAVAAFLGVIAVAYAAGEMAALAGPAPGPG